MYISILPSDYAYAFRGSSILDPIAIAIRRNLREQIDVDCAVQCVGNYAELLSPCGRFRYGRVYLPFAARVRRYSFHKHGFADTRPVLFLIGPLDVGDLFTGLL
jgi:hypothetical protein